MTFPPRLIDGYRAFTATRLPLERSRFKKLAETGQHPEAMVICCCDSRVSPEVIFDAHPAGATSPTWCRPIRRQVLCTVYRPRSNSTSCFPRSCASLALRSVTYLSVLHEPNGRAKQGHDQKRSARSSEVFAKGTRDSSLSASMKYFDRMGATPSEFRLEIIFSAYKCEVDTVIMI